jgi:hypothetical protein
MATVATKQTKFRCFVLFCFVLITDGLFRTKRHDVDGRMSAANLIKLSTGPS